VVSSAFAQQPRRVALISDWFLPRFGGLELQLLGMAKALQAAGHVITVITPTPGPVEVDGIRVHRVGGPLMPGAGIVVGPAPFRELGALLSSGSFDLAHVHVSLVAPFALGGSVVAAQTGIPTAVTFHSVVDYLQPAFRTLSTLANAPQLPVAYSAVSRLVAAEVRDAIPGVSVGIVPNGLHTADWRPARRHRPPDQVHLVCVSRLQRRKRPAALFDILDSAQRIVGRSLTLTTDLIGDGPQAPAIERRIRIEAPGRIRALGRLSSAEVRDHLAGADLFVLPSKLESFGIAALEARCVGVPVVAYRQTGVSDFVKDGVHGLLGDSDSDLALAIARLATDAPLRERMRIAAYSSPPPNDWEDVLVALHAEYDKALRCRTKCQPARNPLA
jgi:glycosyltransferase involved in cell wall biosynthesis